MKRFSSLDVKSKEAYYGLHRSKKHSNSSNKAEEEEEVVSSNHIVVHECGDSDSEIELGKTPETFEDGG